uniref:Unannotated protein n=1 Tax=freshwater metagenome TaxID=449393 RepID=A0A6J7M4E7_9ZZZZ
MTCSVLQSIHPIAPGRMGEPLGAFCQSMPSKRPSESLANLQHSSPCSAPRMFTQNDPPGAMSGQLRELMAGRNPTSGGSSETEQNEPMVSPPGSPEADRPVTIVTPVGKCPRT